MGGDLSKACVLKAIGMTIDEHGVYVCIHKDLQRNIIAIDNIHIIICINYIYMYNNVLYVCECKCKCECECICIHVHVKCTILQRHQHGNHDVGSASFQ